MSTPHYKVIKKPGKSVKDEKRPALSSMVWWTDGFCCISLSSNWIYLCNLNVFMSAIEIFFCPCPLQFPSPFLIVIWAELYFHGKFIITESKRQGGETPTVQTNGSADWCQNAASAWFGCFSVCCHWAESSPTPKRCLINRPSFQLPSVGVKGHLVGALVL